MKRGNFSMSGSMLAELSVRFRVLLTEIFLSEENAWVWACLSLSLQHFFGPAFFCSCFPKIEIFFPEKPSSRLPNGVKVIFYPHETLLKRRSSPGLTSPAPQPALHQLGWRGYCWCKTQRQLEALTTWPTLNSIIWRMRGKSWSLL